MSTPLVWTGGDALIPLPGMRWLTRVEVVKVDGSTYLRDASKEEQLVVLLSGTHDLHAGSGSWAGRGTRESPFDGRPCALYLPPDTRMASDAGRGEILFVAAMSSEPKLVAGEGRRPLLPLAGSNKVYDGESGEWIRMEDMPSSPEAILPRRITSRDVGGVRVEDVFAPEYKAAWLSLSEAVLQEGNTLVVTPPAHAQEMALFCRAEGEVVVDLEIRAQGQGVFSGGARSVPVQSRGGRCYLAMAFAGPKSEMSG